MNTAPHSDVERAFVDHQHRFRGLISEFKSRRFVKDRSVTPAFQFRSGLSDLLLDARATLQRDQYRPFLEWVVEQTAAQLSDLKKMPIGYDELAGVRSSAPTVSLSTELIWISERIRAQRPLLNLFRSAASIVEQATLDGDYQRALSSVESIQTVFGVSLWSVQLRIALEHLAGGLERHKNYAADVRRIYKAGLLGFTSYYTSVRNEERTTFFKYIDDIDGRIARHSYFDDAVKVYARYRLLDRYPASDIGLADILRVEQSHSIIDLYETYVAVLQELSRRLPRPALLETITTSISTAGTNDFRLNKLLRLLTNDTNALPPRETALPDALLAGDFGNAILHVRNAFNRSTSSDPWQFIYGGLAVAGGQKHREAALFSPRNLITLVGAILARTPHSDDVWAQTAKLLLNLRGLPLFTGMLDFLQQIRRVRPDDDWRWWSIGLNSPVYGVEDINLIAQAAPSCPTSLISAVWAEARQPTEGPVAPPSALARAAGHLYRKDHDLALNVLGQHEQSWPEPLRVLRTLLLLHARFALGQRVLTIELIASEGSRGEEYRRFLPIEATLADCSWNDFKSVQQPFAAAIALHLLWSARETSLTASRLRFATGSALKKAGIARPSELIDQPPLCSRWELVYFLRHVCVPDVLDLARLFRSTREILEERQSICSSLIEIDPTNRDIYEDEIVRISNQLASDDGQWIVDRTRIHVDTDALTRWALRELSEDYDRYRDLAGVAISVPQSFDDVLRELAESAHAPKPNFTPDSEADAVLLGLLRRLADEFLTNSTFGLDFYLSKRVRHQSFVGLIRGPLELAGLITTRESEAGPYRRNAALLNTFSATGSEEKKLIDQALRRFSARFDEALTTTKDSYFHLRTIEKPNGMISCVLTDRHIAVARALLRQNFSFPEFLPVAMVILWAAVSPALYNVRTMISGQLKEELDQEFAAVRLSVRNIAEHDPAFLAFDAAMGKASNEVQLKLDEAAHWFSHDDTVPSQRLFSLDQIIKIAVDTALKSHRGFTPVVKQSTDGDLLMAAANLVFVHDVLSVAIGNAQKHSGIRTPKIDVSAKWVEGDSTLRIEVLSDCRQSVRSAKERQAELIRRAISSGDHTPRTRIEGGSGFAKVAAVVGQSELGGIDFGFAEDGRFRLTVTYAVIVTQSGEGDARRS